MDRIIGSIDQVAIEKLFTHVPTTYLRRVPCGEKTLLALHPKAISLVASLIPYREDTAITYVPHVRKIVKNEIVAALDTVRCVERQRHQDGSLIVGGKEVVVRDATMREDVMQQEQKPLCTYAMDELLQKL